MSVCSFVYIISFTASLCVPESTDFPEVKSHLKILGAKMVAEAISELLTHSHSMGFHTRFVRLGFLHHLSTIVYGFV